MNIVLGGNFVNRNKKEKEGKKKLNVFVTKFYRLTDQIVPSFFIVLFSLSLTISIV